MSDPTNVVGRRVGAFLIDLIILQAINFALFFLLADKVSELLAKGDIELDTTVYGNIDIGDEQYSLHGGKFVLYLVIVFAIWFGYTVVLPGLKGWTPGKLLLGIRVVNDQGHFAGIGRNFVRQILWIVDSLPWIVPYLVGFICALTTKGHRRLGDMAAGTYVVSADAVGRPPLAPAFAGAAAGFPQAPGQFAAPPAQPFGGGQPAQPFGGQPVQQPPQQPAAPAAPAGGQPAGWYPDPHGQARLRYWDGSAWTEHTN